MEWALWFLFQYYHRRTIKTISKTCYPSQSRLSSTKCIMHREKRAIQREQFYKTQKLCHPPHTRVIQQETVLSNIKICYLMQKV